MEIKDARTCENLVWALKVVDEPRAANRALIDDLFNGGPPYTDSEAEQNRISTNVNDLSPNRIFHDSTRQFSNAFLKPGNYFKIAIDYGPQHKRTEWSATTTKKLNSILKKSQPYRQTLRNVFGNLVLHGVGPVAWADKMKWCPSMQMMCDVLIPSQTLLTMENLSYFAVYRRYTAAMLAKLVGKPRPDPGWQKSAAVKAIKWARKQTGATMDQNWTPERLVEEVKSNSIYWSSDAVPTINCWDTYFMSDDEDNMGWKRRIIFDCPSFSETDTLDTDDRKTTVANTRESVVGTRDEFLYSSGDRIYARNLSQIIHFQFADGSVVAPYRYHSVRSLGFLLYALCHLHNRLTCRVMDSTFENLLNYIRVQNPDDTERLKKIDLINLGFLPEGWNFVTQQERWQVNQNLIQMVINMNRQQMADSSPSYSQNSGQENNSAVEKTATQIMAEINKASSTIGIILNEAQEYQVPQYEEICRRFCIPNSSDIDVLKFRAAVLSEGVPVEALNVDRWTVTPERVMGNGNKQLELAQAQLMMSNYDKLEPDAQRIALRKFFFAVLDNPSDALELVPENSTTTNSVHDAELASGAMLLGLPMSLKQGVNHAEYAASLLGAMAMQIQKIQAQGATPDDIIGLTSLAGQDIQGQPTSENGAAAHIQILARDKNNKAEVKTLTTALSRVMNQVKALAQQMQQQQQAQNGNGDQLPPEEAVKLKAMLIAAETKAENSKSSHAQKMQQRQQSHDQKLEQLARSASLDDANKLAITRVDTASKDLETAAKIKRDNGQPETVTE